MFASFDPREACVVGSDAHLPLVPRHQMSANALRQRFCAPPVWSPEFDIEQPAPLHESVPATVLIPLVMHDELAVLLTLRADNLKHHPGQICFPGGRIDRDDADATVAALREAQEEIGLASTSVEVLGQLPYYATATGFLIRPVVALVNPVVNLCINTTEVVSAFEVPLAYLMNPSHHYHHAMSTGSSRREFLSMTWQDINDNGEPRDRLIWGATAAMLRNLYRFLSA